MEIKKTFQSYAFPLVLALIAVLAYGFFAFQHGYYWDDWAFSWTRAHLGFSGFLDQFVVNRPIRAYWEGALNFFGAKPAIWQLYAVFVRWAAALMFFAVLNLIWSKKRAQNALAAFFFLLYPGFTQQPLAVTYQFFWTLYIFYFFSLYLLIHAAQNPKHRTLKWMLSFLLAAYTLFGLEYFFGLELVRPLWLWIALKPRIADRKEGLKKSLRFYAPYFLLTLFYLYWRVFLYENTIYEAQEQISLSIVGIWKQLWRTIPLVSVDAWLKVFSQPFSDGGGLSPRLALVMGTILLAGTFLLARYLKRLARRDAEDSSTRHVDWNWLLLSVALILAAGIPFYAVNFPVQLTFPEDRFTFPFIVGVGMLLAWLFSLIKNEMQRFTLAALLISLAITTHIANADEYRREWRLQRLFAQQLFWRAPDIADGTLILAEDEGIFPHNDDEAFAFLVNWAYRPEQTDNELSYDYFYVSARLGKGLPALQEGEPIFQDHFAATFEGNTDQALVLHFAPPSCLRILDPVYDADVLVAPRDVDAVQTGTLTLPRALAPALPSSKPSEWIAKNNANFAPPAWLFGEEPARSWCYYFEKADLARQSGDWEKVAKLGDKAFAVPYAPADAAEYLPFIEAYARLGRDEDARTLTQTAAEKNPLVRPMLCSLWQRVAGEGALGKSVALLNEMQELLSYCPIL